MSTPTRNCPARSANALVALQATPLPTSRPSASGARASAASDTSTAAYEFDSGEHSIRDPVELRPGDPGKHGQGQNLIGGCIGNGVGAGDRTRKRRQPVHRVRIVDLDADSGIPEPLHNAVTVRNAHDEEMPHVRALPMATCGSRTCSASERRCR